MMNVTLQVELNDEACVEYACQKDLALQSALTVDQQVYKEEQKDYAMEYVLEEAYYNEACKITDPEVYFRFDTSTYMESCYDGSLSEGIKDMYNKKDKEAFIKVPMSTLTPMDSKTRKYKPINVIKLIEYLCTVKRTRDLVYNNKWGICVKKATRPNYPMQEVLKSIGSILKEGVESLAFYSKKRALLFLDAAPADTLAAKAWATIPTVTLDPVYGESVPECDGVWEKCLSKIAMSDDENLTEEIPKEDLDFWKAIYKSTYGVDVYDHDGYSYDGHVIVSTAGTYSDSCDGLSDRACTQAKSEIV